MSKKNWLRAKINRTTENGRQYKLVLHTNFIFFENRIFCPYFRQFKTWKHYRNKQYKL